MVLMISFCGPAENWVCSPSIQENGIGGDEEDGGTGLDEVASRVTVRIAMIDHRDDARGYIASCRSSIGVNGPRQTRMTTKEDAQNAIVTASA